MSVESVITEIETARNRRLESLIRPNSSQPYLYLSSIHTCARNLFYRLTDGDKRPSFDAYVQARLEMGNEQERIIKKELLEMGYEMIKAQERIEIPYQGQVSKLRGQLMAVGKIDGVLRISSNEYPVEIKSMNPNMWARINSIDDLINYEHTERYVRQLLLYLYGKNMESGIFIITDCLGHWKIIPIYLGNHLEIAEYALKTMEKAWEAKASNAIPDRVEWHPKTCGRCDFAAICLPDMKATGESQVITDPDVEALVIRHEELKAVKSEFEEVHETVVEKFKNYPQSLVGKFIIYSKQRVRKTYDTKQLDEEKRKEIMVETPYTVVEIKLLDKAE